MTGRAVSLSWFWLVLAALLAASVYFAAHVEGRRRPPMQAERP